MDTLRIRLAHVACLTTVQKASVYDDDEILLALVLKEDGLEDAKCKEKLKKYCENLKEANKELNKIYPKLKDICKDEDKKCTSIKAKITKKCQTHKATLNSIVSKALGENYDCKEDERQCLFLEEACPDDLKEKCTDLRNKCYKKKRDEVAKEVLLRALRSDLNETETCKKKLKEICPVLGRESNELTDSCLNQKETCENIIKERNKKCDTLKTDVKTVLGSFKKEKCLSLLEECYFYVGNCQEDDIIECIKLGEKCQEQNIVYIPPGPDFDPTRPEATLAEDIGLEELYKRAEEDGVFIGRQQVRDATALLTLLVEKDTNVKTKCNEVLKNKCKTPHEHEALENLCKENNLSNDGTKKCDELEKDIKKTCDILTSKLTNNHLFDSKKGSNGIIGWGGLPTFLSNEDCAKLESYCFYFEKKCQDGEKSCANVRAACYKRGLDARANNILQKNMRGLLHGSNKDWLKKFQQELVKVCEKLKGNKGSFSNDELFVLCIQPAKAARLLTHDHQMRVIFLRQQLDKKRDFPTDKDCKELGRKCQDLGKDSKEITWPCHTLEQQCNRLGTTEILKQVLLNEHKDTLKDQESCVKYLKKKCNEWSRRGDDRFSFVCVFQNATCELMVEDVQDRCEVFEKNIKASEIVGFLKNNTNNITTLGNVCPFWDPYCDKFSPNCLDFSKKNPCTKIKNNCKPFYERKALEDALKVELRGKLSEKNGCATALERYCTVAGNANNASIRSLCKDNTKGNPKKDDEVRKELCEKLVKEVEEQCKALPTELGQPAADLKKDYKTYEELKKRAEEAMNKSSLVLSLIKKNESNVSKSNSKNKDKNAVSNGFQDTTEHMKILRRGVKDVLVTELEAKAFDLAAEVFGRYVDLKERCEKLTSDCGIKDDCNDLKDVCEKIEKICRNLKPLEVKPHETVTESTTTTTTTTTTVADPKATECKSLQTTDTWVTQTSTHTSTSTITSTITSKITLTSTRRCKPTKCTTGDDAEDVKPNEGLKMSGWNVMRGVIVAMVISFMI
ncbi:uncharacterized protein T551_01860 [Pneumocystis jirovecii RU7]|uniref:Major surface glycoprotein 2 C-terminal domain-containing protein n=1 Tax=Pneumocystis jirovecii (strain RU7) TaxID=1408657 RepID=A0A0W4ZNF9_PNEJ7|nr:uncharacterized protein T551_01860 [Pneumocystis jirovecii RU7]KTW29916.1 hypothetical protein T551_01860 [Pneumocystis jirovecii RU7]